MPRTCSQLVLERRATLAGRLLLSGAKRAGEEIRWKVVVTARCSRGTFAWLLLSIGGLLSVNEE